jgi:phosphatidylinositol alpha-mannosyltransferase
MSLSLSIKEAMACATPVVRSPDTTDEVLHGQIGFLVSQHDIHSLAEAIVAMLGSPERREEMRIPARQHVEARFSWEAVAQRIWDDLERLFPSCR